MEQLLHVSTTRREMLLLSPLGSEAQELGFEAQPSNFQTALPQATLSCSLGLISS